MKKNILILIILCATINLFSQGYEPHIIPDSVFFNNTAPCGISPEILKKLDVNNTEYNPKTLPLSFPGYAIISCGKFDIYYEDLILTNPQVGFSDPVNGVARRNTLCAVLTYVQSVFDFSNIPSASPIRLHVNESFAPVANPAPPGTSFLAFAGPTFVNNATPGIIKGFVHDYTTTGIDPATVNQYHAELTVNFHQTTSGVIQWQNNHTILPISNCFYDLYSVLLHEIGHTLGWVSYIHHSGSGTPESVLGNDQYSGIDEFLHIGANNYPLSLNPLLLGAPSTPTINPLYASSQAVLTDNEVWINSLAAPNNAPVYSGLLVTFWQQSFSISSILSHLDDQMWVYSERSRISPGNSKDYVMGPFAAKGVLRRTFEDIEINTLLNLGYAINSSFVSITLANSPPYSTRMASYSNFLDNVFPETIPADFPPLVNNIGSSLVINLATDPTIVDAEGDPIFVAPGSLVNIRGCGNGGNNHNSLTVTSTPAGDIITYTPRANFYGRAQFGLRLFDGKEDGSYVIYTIDVLKGSNVSCSSGSNIVLNGDFEEGTEVKRLGSEEILEASVSEQAFLKEGKLRGGIHFGDCHPYNFISNNWAPFGAGDMIKDSYITCNGTIYTSQAGSVTTTFPFGGSAPNPTAANGVGERYRRIFGPFTYFNLCSDAEQCKKYILEFDYFNQPANIPPGTIIPLTIAFTNNATFFPTLPTYTFNFTHNITANNGVWQHISIPFTYCGNTPAGILSLVQTITGFGFLIDNLELKEDLNPQPPLSVNITPVSPTICSGNSVSLVATVNNDLCNVTYNWSPATGLSCTNCPNPIASPTTTTTYTLTVNDGCSTITAQVTVNVDNSTPLCCAASTLTIPNGTTSSSLGTIPNGSVIDVLGLFTINSNLTLTSCTLRMAPNAKIDVLGGSTFTLTACTVFSCTDMWDGIYSNPGANVNITLSRIEDATNAVYSVNGGNYNLFFSTFNKNNISLYVDNFNATHPGIVRRCIFECVAAGSPTPGATLKAPMAGQISHFGIYCRNNADITFGQVSAQPNTFRYIEIGIYALNTQLKVYRNNFNDITAPYCVTTFPPTTPCPTIGWPIWVQSSRLTVGDPAGTSHQNNFTNCSNGIFIDGKSSFDIQKNNFTNIVTTGFLGSLIYSKCIYARFNAGDFPGIIHDNVFTNFEAGIYYQANKLSSFTVLRNKMSNFNTSNGTAVYLLQNQAHPIQIKNNLINDLPNQSGWYGIRVQNAVQPSNNVLIAENTIKNVRHGVWTTNYDNIIIKDQTTAFTSIGTNQAGIYYPNAVPSVLSVGIKVENCPKTNVYNNLIQKAMPNPTTAFTNMLYGISVETNSVGTNVQENEVRRLGKGLNFYGTPNGPLTVSCNKIYQNRTGVSLNNTFIGDQGMPNPSGVAQDNQWSIPGNISTNWLGAERIGTSPATTWYARSTALPFFPNTSNQMIPGLPTPAITFGNASGSPYNCSFGCANPPCFHLIVKKMIIKDTPFDGLDSDVEQIIDMKAYQLIKQDSAYTTTGTSDDALFIAYRDSLANTNIGRLYEFTEKLAAGDTLGAYSSLMAVNPTRCPEVSQKIVYEIYWKTWAKNIFEFEPQDSLLLYQVAEQRPHICGTAVYDARVMLGLDFNDFEDAQARMASIEENEITINDEEGNYKGVLYPNPANDYVIYKTWLNEGETVTIVIYDVMGKPVILKQITGTTEEQFDLSNFSSGIYFYKITLNQKQVQAGKLIINK
jgi:hypothetical protein